MCLNRPNGSVWRSARSSASRLSVDATQLSLREYLFINMFLYRVVFRSLAAFHVPRFVYLVSLCAEGSDKHEGTQPIEVWRGGKVEGINERVSGAMTKCRGRIN